MGFATVNCIVAVAVCTALGILVLSRSPRESQNWLFFMVTMSLAVSAAGELVMRLADSPDIIMLGARIGALGWCTLGGFFLHFTLITTHRDRWLSRWWAYVIVYAPGALIALLAVTTNLIYEGFRNAAGEGFKEFEGPLRYPAALLVVAYFVLALAVLWTFWRKARPGRERENVFLMMAATVFMMLFAIITDVVLIYVHKQNPPVNMFTAATVMAIVVAYAVLRRGFMGSITSVLGGTIVKMMMDPVLVLDAAGAIETANPAMTSLTGFEEEQLKGSGLGELVRCTDGTGDIDEMAVGGEAFSCSGECVLTDGGEPLPVVISSGALKSRYGKLLGSVVILHDMRDTMERIRAEEDVRVARVEAEAERRQADALRGIIDVACHELRTPASVFKGYSVLMLSSLDDLDRETVELALNSMDAAADRVTDLANSLVDAATLESGPLELSLEEVSPSAMTSGSTGVMRKQHPDHVFEVVKDPGERKIFADVDMVEMVLVVLLDNAVKFSPEGSEIRVWTQQDDGATAFHVADRGNGIPPDKREKVFERFYQVEDAAHHSLPGLGLGLYIAKRVVEAHGGHIQVDDAADGGSDFSFTIPGME